MADELKGIAKEEGVTKSYRKLSREKVEISINPKQYLVDYYKAEQEKLVKMDIASMSAEEKALFDETSNGLVEHLSKIESVKLEAVLVPLKYKDLQVIKDGVQEALKYGKEFGWDDDIRMKSVMREQHTLTVYLSLRNKTNAEQRYYRSLEDIAAESELTIEEIYSVYLDNFVLTEEERKNS